MDITLSFFIFGIICLFSIALGYGVAVWMDRRNKKKPLPKLSIHFHNKKNNQHMPNASLVLTDFKPVTGVLSVTLGDNGPVIPGTISNIQEVISDPTQDSVANDAANPNGVDFTALTNTGNSAATVTADFVSTELLADGVTPKYNLKALPVNVAITNNIPVPQPVLNITFP